jgi:subtilisin-like proprotein convertase family protein
LMDPDGGPPVQLFNFSGDNNVAGFNGTNSVGIWTLEVYDTRKKKTGTLNNWSITVDN